MPFCRNCGEKLNEGATVCPICGEAQAYKKKVINQDAEDNRVMAILSYIGPLAFIPYFGAKHSPFTQYHAIRGVNLFLLEAAFGLTTEIVGWFFGLIWRVLGNLVGLVANIGWLACILLSILGIVHVLRSEKKDLPYIGHIRIIRQ